MPGSPFCFCISMNGKGMNAALQFAFQYPVYHAMALNQAFALELPRDQYHLEMGFRAWRDIVVAAFIDDLKMIERQCGCEFLFDDFES